MINGLVLFVFTGAEDRTVRWLNLGQSRCGYDFVRLSQFATWGHLDHLEIR